MTEVTSDGLWEAGSFFHYDSSFFDAAPRDQRLPSVLYGSGRDALRALIEHGLRKGWSKVFVPSYYCHDVTDSIRSLISIEFYPCNFLTEQFSIEIGDSDAFLAVEYFGRRSAVEVLGGTLILDLTHNPYSTWNYARAPDYTFASLRKTHFLPDGGVLDSPNMSALPSPPSLTTFHRRASATMLMGMLMKSAFLAGISIDKEVFLGLAREAESMIGRGETPSAPSELSKQMLPVFNIKGALAKRELNCQLLKDKFENSGKSFVIVDSDAYFIMVFHKASMKKSARLKLIDRKVYPIELWPVLEGSLSTDDYELYERTLMIHCDARYSRKDIELIASAIATVKDEQSEC